MYKIFISHKNEDKSNYEARLLWTYLESIFGKDSTFLDIEKMPGGKPWDQRIYDSIAISDVLIVVSLPETASNWVIREVAYALGRGIAVLPILVDPKLEAETLKVLQALAIEKIHAIKAYGAGQAELRYAEIKAAIPALAKETRSNQEFLIKQLQKRWEDQNKLNPSMQRFTPTKEKYQSYKYEIKPTIYHPCLLHITAGSITEAKGIQVLVNSENMYMQMQRVFESESVSKRIRLDGSHHSGDDIYEDTIQNELKKQIEKIYEKIPVPLESVLVTSAGHQDSKLSKRGFKYIFHVAVVEANTRKQLLVEDENVVKNSVLNCLAKIIEMNDNLQSIIFPVLASGNAGLDYVKSTQSIIIAIKEFLQDNPNTSLKDIYLTGFTHGNIEQLSQIFGSDPSLKRVN